MAAAPCAFASVVFPVEVEFNLFPVEVVFKVFPEEVVLKIPAKIGETAAKGSVSAFPRLVLRTLPWILLAVTALGTALGVAFTGLKRTRLLPKSVVLICINLVSASVQIFRLEEVKICGKCWTNLQYIGILDQSWVCAGQNQ